MSENILLAINGVDNKMSLLAENKDIANEEFKTKCKKLLSEFKTSNMPFYKCTISEGYVIGNTLFCLCEIPKGKINVKAIIKLLDILLCALKNKQAKTKKDKNIPCLLFEEINDYIVEMYMGICISMLDINLNLDKIEQKEDLLKSLLNLLGNNKFTDIVIKSKCEKVVDLYLTVLLNFTSTDKFFYLSDIQKSNFGNTLKYLFQCYQTNNFQSQKNNFQMVFLNILNNLATFISYKLKETEPQKYSSIELGQDVETFIINTLSEINSNESLNQQIFNPNNKLASEHYIRTLVNLSYRIPKFKGKKNIEALLNCINELFANKNFIAVLENNDLCFLFFNTIFNFVFNRKFLDQNQQKQIIKFMIMSIENEVLNKNLLRVKKNFELYFDALKMMCKNNEIFDTKSRFLFTNLIFTIFDNGYLKQFPPIKNNLPAQIKDIKSNNVIINSLSNTLLNYLDNKKINICLEILYKTVMASYSNKNDLSEFLYVVSDILGIISYMDYIFNTNTKNADKADKDKTICLYVDILFNISTLAKLECINDKCRQKILLLVENILNVQKFNPIKTAVFCEENNYKQRINCYITQIFSNLLYFQTIKGTNHSIKDQLIKLFSLILKNEQMYERILFPRDNIDEYYKKYNLEDIELWINMLKKIKNKSENKIGVADKTIDKLNETLKLYKKRLNEKLKPLLLVSSNPSQKPNVNIKDNSMRLSEKNIFVRSLNKRVNNNLIPIQQPISKSKFK